MTDKTNIGGVNISDVSGSTFQTGDISTTITAGGDVVGRDKIVNEITNIVNQALSAAEEAAKAQEFATKKLAEGVQDYLRRLQAIAEAKSDTSSSPYKGLLAYRLGDADRFFGRDRAIAELLAQLQRSPLTILHSESGAGKSSLLQAGIANRLLGQGHLPVYLRPYNQSLALAIKRAFLPNLITTPELAEAPLRDFLRRVTGLLGQEAILILMLDQFEETFTLLDDSARSKFVAELAECLEDESLNVRWVLALRTEFFGNLANFRPRIRNPFENDYRLNRLTSEEAETVTTKPAARQGISFEPELVEALLTDLRDPDSDEVAPPQIQLVCSALYNVLLERQNENRNFLPTITLQMYQAEGQAQGILRGHLNRILRRTFSPQEREAARQVLIALVSSDQRRIRRTKSDLAATLATYLTAAMNLDDLLDQLVDSRLLNADRDDEVGEGTYELAHDYLIAEIEIDPELQARKATQEMLDQEVETYKRFKTLLSQGKLNIISSQLEFIALNEVAEELLQKSQKYYESQRQRELEAMRRLEQTKSDFISVASHELRTPLTIVYSYAQMLKTLPTIESDPVAKEMLTRVTKGTASLREIVNDMVSIIRMELTDRNLDFAPVSVRNIIKNVGEEHAKTVTERKLKLELELTKDLPMVKGDVKRLQSALSRIVGNAIKYTPDGGRISVTSQLVEKTKNEAQAFIKIVIADEGVGIDVDKQKLIFDKFSTAENVALHSTSKTHFMGGAGLGLTIARGIILAHNGHIWVESDGYDPENLPGSKFFVLLPVSRESDAH